MGSWHVKLVFYAIDLHRQRTPAKRPVSERNCEYAPTALHYFFVRMLMGLIESVKSLLTIRTEVLVRLCRT